MENNKLKSLFEMCKKLHKIGEKRPQYLNKINVYNIHYINIYM